MVNGGDITMQGIWKRLLHAAALIGVALLATLGSAGAAYASPHRDAELGPNVVVFDPSMPAGEIAARANAIADRQESDQFGTQRYALLFKPGTYGSAADPLVFRVGYYTEVAGLGASPRDVTIHGAVDVHNQCDASGCTALNNFWRSLSNLTIDIAGQTGCRTGTEFWAVSQASPMRRVNVTGGNVSLMDYCTAGPQYASGGFIADSAFAGGTVINGSQQQFLVRDSTLDGWTNGVWNQVFAGAVGAPAQSFPNPPYTTLDRNPASREKPFLYVSGGEWRVFVPASRTDSRGTTWQAGATRGRSIPLRDFFVARPSDSVQEINAQLARGRDLLFTPGVYDVGRSIRVKRPDTIVLGLGLATLTARDGAVPMRVSDARGVDVAGLMFDAGPEQSPALLRIDGKPGHRAAAEPAGVQDVFFRIGGPHAGRARTSLVVNADDVILDDIWAWRADHGAGVGWTANTADTGVVVNGDDVTATGLFVEHYQRYEVIWNGERGRTVMFQNEMPYDPPDQASWQHDGVLGYAAYKVADDVRTHEGWGLGSYIYTNVNPSLHASHAFEVPVRPGVRFHDLLTVSLNHAGTIDHVINDTGAAVTPDIQGPSTVVGYP
jgi:hypothetical protein